MNIGDITVGEGENEQALEQIGGAEIRSDFFDNNIENLAEISVNDDNSATKIVIEMRIGDSLKSAKDKTPYSILNKVLYAHIDNNSKITRGTDGRVTAQPQTKLADTDLYAAFISEEVNGENFAGEKGALLAGEDGKNHVQVPSVEIDKNGTKYFTLHSKNGILYFDATGKKVTFKDGQIQGASVPQRAAQPIAVETAGNNPPPQSGEFYTRSDYNDTNLNIGTLYVNGEAVESSELSSNYYRSGVSELLAQKTLNDKTQSSRLDLQLNVGSQIKGKDIDADDILKKILGNNFDKSSKVKENGGKYSLESLPFEETDLYRAFVSSEVNRNNFSNGKIIRAENGSNLVQFPALEADENGSKYYILYTNNNDVLYFNDRGEAITPTV